MNVWIRIDKSRSTYVGVFEHTTLNGIGRCHSHDDRIQWVMPVTDGYYLTSSNTLSDLPVSSVTIIPPETEHCHVTKQNPAVLLVSMDRQVWNNLITSWQDDGGNIPRLSGTSTRLSSNARHLIRCLYQTAKLGSVPGSSALLESLSMLLGISWLQDTSSAELRFQHEEAIEKLCVRLRQYLAHSWTIDDMAREVALSPAQLLRCFLRTKKTSPHRYLVRLRLEFAIGQLSRTAKSIDVVAQESGFRSLRGFEMALRSHYGVSPSQVRRLASPK